MSEETCRFGTATEESIEDRMAGLLEFCGELEGQIKELRRAFLAVAASVSAARIYLR